MCDRCIERLGSLPGQVSAAEVDGRERNYHWHASPSLLKDGLDRVQCRFGVESIEDRLDQQNVNAAVQETMDGFRVSVRQLVKGHITVGGVVYVW